MPRCPHCNEVQFKESHKPDDCGLKESEYDYQGFFGRWLVILKE